MRMRRVIAIFPAVLAVCLAGSAAEAPKKGPIEKLIANAINLGSGRVVPGGQAGFVLITIDRWSTPAERQALVEAFQQKGQDGLLRALQKTPRVGVLRTPDRLGWDLRYAVEIPTEDGGRRILLATERRIGFWEASQSPRVSDYPFTLIEVRLDAESKGEGRMAMATKVSRSKDGQHIELENYGTEPVRLQNVRREK